MASRRPGGQFGCGLGELRPCRHPLIIPGSCDTPEIADQLTIRAYDEAADRQWLEARLDDGFGAGHLQARRGELIDVLTGEGAIAERDGEPIGVALWHATGNETELTYLWAFEAGASIGTRLMEAMSDRVATAIWVVTTNDNVGSATLLPTTRLPSTRAPSRRSTPPAGTSPTIPVEHDGIAIHDEIELVLEDARTPAPRGATGPDGTVT